MFASARLAVALTSLASAAYATGIEDCSGTYALGGLDTIVFAGGEDGGVWSDPTLFATEKTLFAFAEYTIRGEKGYDVTDVYVRRSYDGGENWTERPYFLRGDLDITLKWATSRSLRLPDGHLVVMLVWEITIST